MMQLDVKLSFKHRSQNCSCVSWISSDTISPLQKLWPKKDHRVSKGPGLVVLIERLLFCIHAFIAAIWQRNFHHEDIWQCNSNEAFSESPLRDVWKCNFNVHVLWRAPLRGPRIYRMKTYTQVYTRDRKGLGRSIWKALCEGKHVRLFSTPVQATRGTDLPTFWYTKCRAMTAREHPWQNVPDEFSWRGGILSIRSLLSHWKAISSSNECLHTWWLNKLGKKPVKSKLNNLILIWLNLS